MSSSSNSRADIIVDLKGLLDAGDRSPELQQGVEVERQTLAVSVTEVETLKARQEELTGLRQEVTQQLKAATGRAKEAGMRYRSIVKAKIGPHNERLAQFKIAPVRPRPRKQKIVEKVVLVVKSPDGETSATEPDASVSPSIKPVV